LRYVISNNYITKREWKCKKNHRVKRILFFVMHLRVNTDEKLNGFREKDQLVFVFL
jgi:hypothetical protein